MIRDKILIIGSLGMLGQELLKIFPEASGWDVENFDITDKKKVWDRIAGFKPKIVINAAAYNAVDKCEEDEEQFELAEKVNGYAAGYLAEACQKINAVLVHYSTNYVFAGDKQAGYNEDDAPKPLNRYGESKLLGEREIIKRGSRYYIIRLSKLFGKKGESKMAKENFFDIMIKTAAENNEIKVVDDELSNFTYAPDLAMATKDLLEIQPAYGVYHLPNECPCTWYESAKTLFDILGKHVKLMAVKSSEFPRPAKRPKYAVLNNNKLPKLRDYKEALEEYLREITNIK